MWKKPTFFGLYAEPGKRENILLAMVPLLFFVALYIIGSEYREIKNPGQKLVPTIGAIADSTGNAIYKENRRTGEIESQLLNDTRISLFRIFTGLSLSALLGLLIGLNLGVLPGPRAMFNPTITFFSNIPPPAIMPIFMIVFGSDEYGKVALIFFGTFFGIARDVQTTAEKFTIEQKVKTNTLGGSTWDYLYQIALPQILPKLIETVRINFSTAWIYLIMAEALTAESGLGYRIFLVRRFMDMATIIPYTLWIVAIAYFVDRVLALIGIWAFPWYSGEQSDWVDRVHAFFRRRPVANGTAHAKGGRS